MSVIVEFHGICTFVSQQTVPALPTQWRAVLVQAAKGAVVDGIPIGPHVATASIDDLEPIHLKGYRLHLGSPLPPDLKWTSDFNNLPNLTKLMSGVEPVGPPADDVVLNGDPERTAAFFDFTTGTLTAGLTGLMAATTLLTVDHVAGLALVIETFSGDPVEVIPLHDGSRVLVGNIDELKKNTGTIDVDFLLHYRTAATLPRVPQVPQAIVLPRISAKETVGAGCSNSQYP